MNKQLKNTKKLALKKITVRDLQNTSAGALDLKDITGKIVYPAEYLSIAAC